MSNTTLPSGVVVVSELSDAYTLLARRATARWSESMKKLKELAPVIRERFNELNKDFNCGKAIEVTTNGLTTYQPYDLYERLNAFLDEAESRVTIRTFREGSREFENLLRSAISKRTPVTLAYNPIRDEWTVSFNEVITRDTSLVRASQFVHQQANGIEVEKKLFEVWREGSNDPLRDDRAFLFGTAYGPDFTAAARQLFETRDELDGFDEVNLTYHGRKLFDNEADARSSFG